MKVGKKTPLNLACFGFDKDGSVLPEFQLLANFVAGWKGDAANAGKPFPSHVSSMPFPTTDKIALYRRLIRSLQAD